jgi:hypothetical protein
VVLRNEADLRLSAFYAGITSEIRFPLMMALTPAGEVGGASLDSAHNQAVVLVGTG